MCNAYLAPSIFCDGSVMTVVDRGRETRIVSRSVRASVISVSGGFRAHQLAGRRDYRHTGKQNRDRRADDPQPPGAHEISIAPRRTLGGGMKQGYSRLVKRSPVALYPMAW
jgi:hypothetical protein